MVTPCGVTLTVFNNSAPSKQIYVVRFLFYFYLHLIYVYVFESFFLPLLMLYDRLPMKKEFDFICVTKRSNFLALKVCAWSRLNCRGTPLFEMYCCINFVCLIVFLL